MINERLNSESLSAVREHAKKMASFFNELSGKYKTFESRLMKRGSPHAQLIITDHTALVLQYMYSRGTAESPLLQLPKGTDLYNAYTGEFEDLWQLNSPGDDS
ncbi:unnamed protein product [marine sediment metagenome]|uniref:Uncharacterized protein n=1 Tax=marine sediment metagenome TaxID=412755 RepID=X1BD51_9ZZZZ